MRLFVGLSLPKDVADAVLALEGGVPGARWQHREQLHMTVRFIGETDGATANLIDDALGAVVVPAFQLQLKGVGIFGGRMPHSLWAGVADDAPLQRLNRKVEIALQHIGLEPQARKYIPHVTIARLTASPRGRVAAFASENNLFASPTFMASAFTLFSSMPGDHGSMYQIERVYPLAPA